MRLIDADKFCDIIDGKCLELAKKLGYKSYKDTSENMKWYLNGVSDSVGTVLDMPTVDAVEVTRCKDCEYWRGEGKYCDYDMSGLADDYCSWGVRRVET